MTHFGLRGSWISSTGGSEPRPLVRGCLDEYERWKLAPDDGVDVTRDSRAGLVVL